MRKEPFVICPSCHGQGPLSESLTAQSNQNVIFTCAHCHATIKNIETSKGKESSHALRYGYFFLR